MSIFTFLLHWLQLFPLSGSNLRVDPDSVSFLFFLDYLSLPPLSPSSYFSSFSCLRLGFLLLRKALADLSTDYVFWDIRGGKMFRVSRVGCKVEDTSLRFSRRGGAAPIFKVDKLNTS